MQNQRTMIRVNQKEVDAMEQEFLDILHRKGLRQTPRARASTVKHLIDSNVFVAFTEMKPRLGWPLQNGYEIADVVLRSACVYAKRGVDVSSRESLARIADEVAERILEITNEDARQNSAWGGWERLLSEHDNAWMKHYPDQWNLILRWEKALVA